MGEAESAYGREEDARGEEKEKGEALVVATTMASGETFRVVDIQLRWSQATVDRTIRDLFHLGLQKVL